MFEPVVLYQPSKADGLQDKDDAEQNDRSQCDDPSGLAAILNLVHGRPSSLTGVVN
jgi:hypothetical protein